MGRFSGIERAESTCDMKKTIILLVLLVALGGGGYFGWQQMDAAEPSAETGQAEGGGFFSNDEPKFVELDLLTAPFVRGGKFVPCLSC